jgi:hypothetical protein
VKPILSHILYVESKNYTQTFKIQKCCCSSVQPFDFCKTMAECDKSAVISENPPGTDSTNMMDTSWSVSSSRKRAPKSALRNDRQFMKSTDSLVDVNNPFDGLTDEEEGEVLGPSTKVLPTPPPRPAKRHSLTSAQAPVADQQPKRVRVPTITIKWELTRVRSEIVLSNMKNSSFILKQVHGGRVVNIATMDEYEAFLKRCTERHVPFFTHQVDAKKPTRIVLLGLPDMPANEKQEALAERGIIPDDIKPMNIRSKDLLEHSNYILYFAKGSMTTGKLRDIKAINNVIVRLAYYDAKRHGPTQCRRCQEWGHGSSHCHVAHACVKCAGQHETSACNLVAKGINLPVEQLKCANCNCSTQPIMEGVKSARTLSKTSLSSNRDSRSRATRRSSTKSTDGRVSRASNQHSKVTNGYNSYNTKGPHGPNGRNPDRHPTINNADQMI